MAPRRTRFVVLLVALALLAPLAAVADPCPDCGPAQDCCCSPGCRSSLGCTCGLVLTVLTATLRVDASSAWTGLVGHPPADRRASGDPRDVFHVPKPPLA
jgi:hypothetical protein